MLSQCSGHKLAGSISQRMSRQAKQVYTAASGSLEYAGNIRTKGHGSSSALVIWDINVSCKDACSFWHLSAVSVGLQLI